MKLRSFTFGVAVLVTAIGSAPAAAPAHARQPLGSVGIRQAPEGKEIYLKNCKQCHGVLGAPTKASLRKYEKIPDFTNAEFFKTRTHEELLESIEKGKGRDMKGFADKLSKDEMKAVMEYIHTLVKKS